MPTRRGRPRAVLATLVLGVSVLGAAFLGGPAGAAPPPVPDPAPAVLHVVTAADVDSADLARRLLDHGLDVVARDGDRLVVVGPENLTDQLRRLGAHPVERRIVPPAAHPRQPAEYPLPRRLAGRTYPTVYGGYRTVEAFRMFHADLAAAYPELVRRVEYGQSWRRTQDATTGHPLEALCVTANAANGCALRPDSAKPRFLVMAQIHARELTAGEIAWRLLTHLVDAYQENAEVTALLESTEVWVVPQANPDGTEVSLRGLEEEGTVMTSPAWQRKNVDDADNDGAPCTGPWAVSQDGVDLNRNWDSHWGGKGSSPDRCNLAHHGPKAASEPETSQLATLFERLFPDQRGPGAQGPAPPTARGAMVTLHSFSDLVLLPWGYDSEVKTPNDAGLRSMAFRMSYYNGYRTGQPGEVLYDAAGGTDDWTYERLGLASFTYEVGPVDGECSGFFPPYSCQERFWTANRPALLYAAKAARQPYALSLGPTVTALELRRARDAAVEVTARADDDAYGRQGVGRPAAQRVTEAELYLGRAPWDGGRPLALQVHGDGSAVELRGTIDAPDAGHPELVYVRAKDADGNWGPVAVAWLPR